MKKGGGKEGERWKRKREMEEGGRRREEGGDGIKTESTKRNATLTNIFQVMVHRK